MPGAVLLGCIKWQQQQQQSVLTSSFNPRQSTGITTHRRSIARSSRRRDKDSSVVATRQGLDDHFHSFSNIIQVNRNVSFPFRPKTQYRLFTFNPSGMPLFVNVHFVCCVKFSLLSPCSIHPTPAHWPKNTGGISGRT